MTQEHWTDKIEYLTDEQKLELAKETGIGVVERNDKRYYQIKLQDINTKGFTEVQRIKDVVAFTVESGSLRYDTDNDSSRYLDKKHYIVCYIAKVDYESLTRRILESPKYLMSAIEFETIFNSEKTPVKFNFEEMLNVKNHFQKLNSSNQNYNEEFIENCYRYTIFGKKTFAAKINFNAVIILKNGEELFVNKGGAVLHNPDDNLPEEEKFKVMEGAVEGKMGQFEQNYGVPKSDEIADGKAKGTISDTFKNVIKSDRSPVAGIQFNNIQVAKAFEKIGKEVPKLLERYLDM